MAANPSPRPARTHSSPATSAHQEDLFDEPKPIQTPRGGRRKPAGSKSQPAARGGKGRTSADDRGEELERRVARIEFGEGALTRMRVLVRTEAADPGRRVLTDIDVLAIDVDLRLRVSTALHECKSEAGESGEPDRLFWLAGFRQYVGASRATLVRRTATRRGQALAQRLNVRLLDEATLTQREAEHAWLPDRFAHVGGLGCKAAESRTDGQLKGLPEISGDLVPFLRHDAFFSTPAACLSVLISLGERIQRFAVLPRPAGLVVAGHALNCLLLAAIQDAGNLDVVPPNQLALQLSEALTVGAGDTNVLDLLRSADALVAHLVEDIHLGYTSRGVARLNTEVPSLQDLVATPPKNAIHHYIDLVQRFRANPTVARDIAQTAELVCFDALVGDNAWRARAFDHLFTPEHRQLLLTSIKALEALCGRQVAVELAGVSDLPFDRAAPAVSERTTGLK